MLKKIVILTTLSSSLFFCAAVEPKRNSAPQDTPSPTNPIEDKKGGSGGVPAATSSGSGSGGVPAATSSGSGSGSGSGGVPATTGNSGTPDGLPANTGNGADPAIPATASLATILAAEPVHIGETLLTIVVGKDLNQKIKDLKKQDTTSLPEPTQTYTAEFCQINLIPNAKVIINGVNEPHYGSIQIGNQVTKITSGQKFDLVLKASNAACNELLKSTKSASITLKKTTSNVTKFFINRKNYQYGQFNTSNYANLLPSKEEKDIINMGSLLFYDKDYISENRADYLTLIKDGLRDEIYDTIKAIGNIQQSGNGIVEKPDLSKTKIISDYFTINSITFGYKKQ